MSSAISRRCLPKTAGALASVDVLLVAREGSRGLPTDDSRPRDIALIGDRYHNSDYIQVALNRLFRELNLSFDYSINYHQISARLLASYRLFVVLRDGMIWRNGYLEPNTLHVDRVAERVVGPDASGLPRGSRDPGMPLAQDPWLFLAWPFAVNYY
jgi:hypothetical protein